MNIQLDGQRFDERYKRVALISPDFFKQINDTEFLKSGKS